MLLGRQMESDARTSERQRGEFRPHLSPTLALLTALSSEPVDWESLLPDVWIAAHPEHFLTFRRDEAEAAAIARRRRRERRRAKAPELSRSPFSTIASGNGPRYYEARCGCP